MYTDLHGYRSIKDEGVRGQEHECKSVLIRGFFDAIRIGEDFASYLKMR
jgi:hypothetical protein